MVLIVFNLISTLFKFIFYQNVLYLVSDLKKNLLYLKLKTIGKYHIYNSSILLFQIIKSDLIL